MKRLLLALLCLGGLAADSLAATKPNTIVFLADDAGWADFGFQGGGIAGDFAPLTPNIDSIASGGVKFSNGYVAGPWSSPSRAGLMTGRHPLRFGVENDLQSEPNAGLPATEKTIGDTLKAQGYRCYATGMVGKWHIGFKEGLRPHERGFDYHYGFLSGARTYMPGKADNDPLLRNGQPVTDEKEYLTDAFAREAVAFLDRSKDKPFFLYVAFNAVHSPLEATEPYLARFPKLTGTRRIHAGMVAAMDDAVGRVLGKVRALGQEENTLIFFYSDNGGPTQQTTSSNEPLRGYKGQFYEGGIRVPFLMQWKGVVPAGQTYREMVMGFDCHATTLAVSGHHAPRDESKNDDLSRSERTTLDGVNLLPFLTGKQTGRPHDQLFWRAGEKHAARVGDWKLVQERDSEAQLFNLKDDISEKTDLAAKEPAKLKELQAAYAAWDKQMMPAQWRRQDSRTEGAKSGKAKAGGIEERFKQYDKNGDGKLTPAEFPLSSFKQADKNNDGVLTLDEVKAYYGGRRQKAKQEE